VSSAHTGAENEIKITDISRPAPTSFNFRMRLRVPFF
jgi:hypothetical protein